MDEQRNPVTQSAHILIVEDSPTQAEELGFMLEQHGYVTSISSNGREALQQLKKNKPDLIVSDILMPEMDGYELCHNVKSSEVLKNIPIMLLTVLSDPTAVLKGLECGASSFFTKPYEEDDLVTRINYILTNIALRKKEPRGEGLDVSYGGEDFHVTAERQQILDLLLSTYSTAVQKNLELINTQEELQELNDTLEQKVRERTAELTLTEASLRRANRALRTISRCNEVLVRAKDESTLLEEICQTITESAGYRMAWVGYCRENEARSLSPVAKAGIDAGFLEHMTHNWTDTFLPAAEAVRQGNTVAIADIEALPQSPWREEATQHGYFSMVALPLRINEQVIGTLSINSAEPGAFGDEEVKLLAEMSNDLSYGINSLRTTAAREQAEQQLALAARVFECSAEGIIITDFNREIVSVNRAFTEVTGYSQDEVLGMNPRILASGRHDRDFYRIMWASIEQTGHWAGEVWNRRKNGNLYPEWLDVSAINNEAGDTTNYVGVFSDISQRKELESTVRHLSQFDALTNLPNRLLLNDRLNSAISMARKTDSIFAVFAINIDHFKVVNDAYGFVSGDAILITTAQRLTELSPEGSTLSRSERDNFIAIIGPLEKEQDAVQLAVDIKETITKPFEVDEQDIRLTASIGISFFPANGDTAPELLKNADIALNRAREMGRNTYRLFDVEMDKRTQEELILEANLHAALERNELQVYYQPQMDLYNGEIVGLEALLRWQHPVYGQVSPEQFIPIAEETGLIIPIGDWVLQESCRQVKCWQVDGFEELRLAVNVSPLQTMQPGFSQRVNQILNDTGFEPDLLELELTESMFLKTIESTTANLEELKSGGIHFAIDDFGTGYAGFDFLHLIPAGKIKIDKSFISNVTQNPSDAAIVQAITAMGRGLQLKVIAEGVDNDKQMKYLRSIHCDEIQGFHFSRPLSAESVLPFLLQKRLPPTLHSPMAKEIRTLLIVDDVPTILMVLKRLFSAEGYRVLAAGSGEEALELLSRHQVGVLITDQLMPEMSGTELLNKVQQLYPNTVRVMLSGYLESEALSQAMNSGEIQKFIAKPWDDEELRKNVREAFIQHEALLNNKADAQPKQTT